MPEERLGRGAVPGLSLAENALLTGYGRGGLVRHGLIRIAAARRFARAVDRSGSMCAAAAGRARGASLSGGNLQKFIVGREIMQEPGVLVVSQPTWGVDAGAAALIRQALLDLAAHGAAVLVISAGSRRAVGAIATASRCSSRGRLSPLRPADALDARGARAADGRRPRTAGGRGRARDRRCA